MLCTNTALSGILIGAGSGCHDTSTLHEPFAGQKRTRQSRGLCRTSIRLHRPNTVCGPQWQFLPAAAKSLQTQSRGSRHLHPRVRTFPSHGLCQLPGGKRLAARNIKLRTLCIEAVAQLPVYLAPSGHTCRTMRNSSKDNAQPGHTACWFMASVVNFTTA